MPVFKTEEIRIDTVFGQQYVKVKIMVNAQGLFYANMNSEMLPAIESVLDKKIYVHDGDEKVRITCKTFEDLITNIKRICKLFMEPEVTETPVIRYNIESHVSFAQDEEGNIYPNAGYPGAKWLDPFDKRTNAMFGCHHSSNIANGGYSLTVGAIAQLKTVYKYGDKEKIEYRDYFADGNNLGRENPAERLNSWCSFNLGRSPKEIPYTDEAAEFFYNLMYNIVKLSKMVQESTFEQTTLLELISNSNKNLLTANIMTVDATNAE